MKALNFKIVRYFFTAGAAAVVDVSGFAVLSRVGLPLAVSAVASFCIATVVNYLLTSRCVFSQRPSIRGYGFFFLAALGGLMVNVSITLIGSLYLAIEPVVSKVLGVGTAFLVNFWLNQQVVFRVSPTAQSARPPEP